MWLPWDVAAILSICFVVFALTTRSTPWRWLALAGGVAKEAAIVLGLYAVWQKAGALAVTRVDGAVAHARSIWQLERVAHLPSELILQRATLGHPIMVEAFNGFYAVVHVPALIVFLFWMYARHRDRYPSWRNRGALLTGACLVIQTLPVAPPRLLPALGFVDTATRYGQSVYGPGGISIAPQLAAMPSVHVAWAAFIAIATVQTARSRWRWLVLVHPTLTMIAVVATANHWWLDGIVAIALLAPAVMVERAATSAVARLRARAVVRYAPAET